MLPRMSRYLIQNYIHLPSNTSVYVFGSYLNCKNPKDIDILIVFDPNHCAPEDVYNIFGEFIESISAIAELPPDVTFLTISEENEVHFAMTENASLIYTS